MGEPTATQVMLTFPPGMISLSAGGMEKRGGTRRTGANGNEGRKAREKKLLGFNVSAEQWRVIGGGGLRSEIKFYDIQVGEQAFEQSGTLPLGGCDIVLM